MIWCYQTGIAIDIQTDVKDDYFNTEINNIDIQTQLITSFEPGYYSN